jgi:hypothetical protein
VDLFAASPVALAGMVQMFLDNGATLDTRNEAIWSRWSRYGIGENWKTHSIRMHSKEDIELNLVYKTEGRIPLRTTDMVLSSFDFGMLLIGYDCRTGRWKDKRLSEFPGEDKWKLGLAPEKEFDWVRGFFAPWIGLRQSWRWAVNIERNAPVERATLPLAIGYEVKGSYLIDKKRAYDQSLGEVYLRMADRIRNGDTAELIEAYEQLETEDELDAIMAALT